MPEHTFVESRFFRSAASAACAMLVLGACARSDVPVNPDPLPAPPGGADATIAVATAAPGASVDIVGSGFHPNADVQIGFGPPQSEYTVITTTRANSAGRVETSFEVPAWAERGRPYVAVLNVPGGDRAVTDPFVVGGPGDSVRVDGTVSDEGVECPAVRGRAGELYTLTGLDASYETDTRVRVWGRIVEASICMQGVTVQVDSIARM